MADRKIVSLRLEPGLHDRVRLVAMATDSTVTDVMTQAIAKAVDIALSDPSVRELALAEVRKQAAELEALQSALAAPD